MGSYLSTNTVKPTMTSTTNITTPENKKEEISNSDLENGNDGLKLEENKPEESGQKSEELDKSENQELGTEESEESGQKSEEKSLEIGQKSLEVEPIKVTPETDVTKKRNKKNKKNNK